MAYLAETRGVLFYIFLLEPIILLHSQTHQVLLHVPAGATGAAVVAWKAGRAGYFVEFDGYGACGVYADASGKAWQRVDNPEAAKVVN